MKYRLLTYTAPFLESIINLINYIFKGTQFDFVFILSLSSSFVLSSSLGLVHFFFSSSFFNLTPLLQLVCVRRKHSEERTYIEDFYDNK